MSILHHLIFHRGVSLYTLDRKKPSETSEVIDIIFPCVYQSTCAKDSSRVSDSFRVDVMSQDKLYLGLGS